jgi:amidophosphoribosyltransferase
MEGEINENCGLCVTHTLHDAYSFGSSVNHRGREVAGIAAFGHDRIDVIKWKGKINSFGVKNLYRVFPGHNYHTFLVHVRYATRGKKEEALGDGHPHAIGGKIEDKGSHMLILDCGDVIIHNGQVDTNSKAFDFLDKTKLRTGCDSESILHFIKEKGAEEFLRQVPSSYVFAATDKKNNRVIIGRDPRGMKPGCLFWKDGQYGIVSEDIAARKNGGTFIENLVPGSLYYLYPNYQQPKPVKIIEPRFAHCFFEWNYIADVDSILDGLSVRRVREGLGESLAQEFSFQNTDIVSYIPDCPEVAARAYAKRRGIEFLPIFYKMKEERSFQGPTLEERANSINSNLFLIPEIIEQLREKNLVIVDDSFVRGNVLKKVQKLFNGIDTKEIHIVSYTPPIGVIGIDGIPRGCRDGVDMPPEDCFLARGDGRNKTSEEISAEYGGKIKIHYLSVEGMLRTYEKLGMPRENLDFYCIGGNLPL